jgi:hypothetical protein
LLNNRSKYRQVKFGVQPQTRKAPTSGWLGLLKAILIGPPTPLSERLVGPTYGALVGIACGAYQGAAKGLIGVIAGMAIGLLTGAVFGAAGGHGYRSKPGHQETMYVIWRGWGPLALAVLILPAASCSGLTAWNPPVAFLAFGTTLAGGGWVCRHFGRKWNQGSGKHMMYWVPLEIWGGLYYGIGLLVVGLCAVALVVALVKIVFAR